MIRRGRRSGWSTAAWGRGDETESLHTDVMRFMAILGLCLTAVFALVQSISVREPEHRAEAVPDDASEREIALLEEKARSLQLELDRLAADIREALQSRDIATQKLTSTQERLAVVSNDTVHKTKERDRVRVELAALTQELQQRRDELDRIRQESRERRTTLAGLSRRLEQERKELDRIEERVEAVEVSRAATPIRPAAIERQATEVDSTKQGFTLRFASAEALHRLVEKGEVTLYRMAGEYAWRLSLGTGDPVFVRAVFPRKFHEMASDTVPARYVGAFTHSAPDTKPMRVIWGVKLPRHTEQRIAMLTRQLTGGTLVIGADGQVEKRRDGVRE